MEPAVSDLRCERLVSPVGVGTPTPRLSWILRAPDGLQQVTQEAWQVQVGHGTEVIWDTGRVEGWQQTVRYAGPALSSRARRWWRVRAWTRAGVTAWSESAEFELGLLDAEDWSASMITATAVSPVLRFSSAVRVDGEVVAARLYVTAHGTFVPYLNGEQVGDEVLAPGWTSYGQRLAVRTHDVTPIVREGHNEVAVLVAPGWFSGRIGIQGGRPNYGTHVGLLAQLEVQLAGGRTVVLATDPSWNATSTPYLLAEIYDGETYDASAALEPAAVSTVEGFQHSVLCAPSVRPVRRTQTIRPVDSSVMEDGAVIVDFGQNVVGRLRLTLRGVAPGTQTVIRHAEVLDHDGRLFTAPLRSAKATDTYLASGDGLETYEPTFTFHGFRYAEISGVTAQDCDVEAVVLHSDLERTGTFTCSDPLVNRLHDNVVWSQRGNFVSIPSDCPQRDERLGWTGDAQVFAPTASFLFDSETFWENWLADLAADQRPDGSVPHVVPDVSGGTWSGAAGWGDAAVVIPWATYEAYGDSEMLRRAMPSMVAWIDYVRFRLDDDLRWTQDFQFGDWLDPDAPIDQPWRAKARYDLVATAYAVHTTALVARAARAVGEDEIAAGNEERAAALKESWWRHYAEAAATTQTGCALAIELDLPPSADDRQRLGDALARLVSGAGGHLSTGFLGTPLLLPALTRTGHLEVAYQLLHQETHPSWLYPVRAGATTIWERWDALRPDGSVPLDALQGGSGAGMVSFNHYAYGSVAAWLHRTVAGLAPDPDDPGYHHVLVRPRPGGRLTSAAAELRTRYGHTAVSWKIERGELVAEVVIPPNAWATVELPGCDPVDVGSGTWRFTGPRPAVPARKQPQATPEA